MIGLRALFTLVCFMAFAVACSLFSSGDIELGNGHQLTQIRDDDYFVIKHGSVVVPSTIVDYQKHNSFVVGLLMPINYRDCGSFSDIRVLNLKRYFTLDLKTSERVDFESRSQFEAHVVELLGSDFLLLLDHSKFERLWAKYSEVYKNIDGSAYNCNNFPLDSLEFERSQSF